MLTMTENARSVVKTLTGQFSGAGAGLRIAGSNAENTAFAATVRPAPEPADQIVENRGARLFLAPGAAAILSDKVLDAHVDDKGAVSFDIGALA